MITFPYYDFDLLIRLDFNENEADYIWKYLLKHKCVYLYNLIITIKFCLSNLNFNYPLTEIEQKVYADLSDLEIKFFIIKNTEIILKRNFNEMIKKDLDIIKKDVWVGINLDSFYFINFNHLNYTSLLEKKKKPELYKKILNINIIVSSLERIIGVIFYTKLKKLEYPKELKENIPFTKGYLICFEPSIVKKLKLYKYDRKLVKKKAIEIKILKKNINFSDSLNNENFSSPIWINPENLNLVKNDRDSIWNGNLLDKPSNIGIVIKSLNHLNSVKVSYNKNIFHIITQILELNTNLPNTLTTKHNLENIIYKINSSSDINLIDKNYNLQSLISSASILELIKEQLKYNNFFYFDHRLDDRLRIYCYPWPINYQLNHVIRNILMLVKKINLEDVWLKFTKHKIIKKYLKNFDIFEYNKDNVIEDRIDNFFISNKIKYQTRIEELFKKEYFYQIMIKLSSNTTKNTSEAFNFSFINLEKLIKSDIIKDWEYWLNFFKIKKKKLPYLINYYNSLKNIHMYDNFDNIFWGDASSNAIQLVTLRLENHNDFLLKLVNIIDNDTAYVNIYEYVTVLIKKTNHLNFLNEIDNVLSSDEISFLQDVDNSKYLLMPSTYGMGKISYRDNLNKMISNDERVSVWEKLNNDQKVKISDYFWNLTEKILLDIGFNMNEYKNVCKNFYCDKEEKGFIWKNDLNVTISPITLKQSKRHNILNKINILKMKRKEITNEDKLEKLTQKIEFLNNKLKNDDKSFWKRTLVKTENNQIFSRIYFPAKNDIDKVSTQQAITPNTVHSYDACNMHLSTIICSELGIEILTIHDSIGCHSLFLPMVKYIFKIANIYFLDKNNKKTIFPFVNKKKIKYDKNELFEKILKSKNFFK